MTRARNRSSLSSEPSRTQSIVDALTPGRSNLAGAQLELAGLAAALEEAAEARGGAALRRIGQLLALAESEFQGDADGPGLSAILEQSAHLLRTFDAASSLTSWGERTVAEIDERWGDLLGPTANVGDDLADAAAWGFDPGSAALDESQDHDGVADSELAAGTDIGRLLSALGGAAEMKPRTADPRNAAIPKAGNKADAVADLPGDVDESIDPELLSAFVDDAVGCLEQMEAARDDVLENRAPADALRQFCRQLHTLKGASGSVGLHRMSRFLHRLEDRIEEMAAGRQEIQADSLTSGVDAVRAKLKELGASDLDLGMTSGPTASVERETRSAPASDGGAPRTAPQSDADAFVRIETTRVDHLLDLLSELVMLRGRRETNLQQFRRLKQELDLCIERTRNLGAGPTGIAGGTERTAPPGKLPIAGSARREADVQLRGVMELANDLGELSQTLRTILEPMEQDNSAVSHLIGRFRRELMDLRRLPMTGLFRRIEKAAADAARLENKRIEVEFRGQGTRAERMLQERLFEPLMHLVRNGVGHGIETPAERRAQGKPEAGRIILEATSTPTALLIEVRDDGRGLDDRAIEKKGKELGLIPPGARPRSQDLWTLIFHPGFSTREQVNEVAGRGVGMDVVATRIRQMRGRLTVESSPRQGTLFRVLIPLRSPIEHAMIVRAGGQCFALPMQAVFGLGEGRTNAAESEPVCLSDLLGLPNQGIRGRKILTLSQQAAGETALQHSTAGGTISGDRRLSIAVDSVLGVEEVVVRSLPQMLSGNDLFAGVTLGADAEIVLICDALRLIEHGLHWRPIADRTSCVGAAGKSPTPAVCVSPPSRATFASPGLKDPGRRTTSFEKNRPSSPGTVAATIAPAPAIPRTEPVSVAAGDERSDVESDAPFSDRDLPGERERLPILIVDDSLSVRRHIVRKLQALGCATAEAGDGQDALEMLRERPFAAMITDIDMPRINGTALLAEIRQRSAWRRMPIYVVSSRTERLLQEQLLKLGAKQVFAKPITDSNVGEIVTQVSLLLEQHRHAPVKETP